MEITLKDGEKERAESEERKMAIKVYGMKLSNNAVGVIAALNEKGLEYKYVPIDLSTGAHKNHEFHALIVSILIFLSFDCISLLIGSIN